MPTKPSLLEIIHGDHELQPIVQPERAESASTLERQFIRFHELNPHVYEQIVQISLALRERGFKKAGMKMIFERLRWLWAMQTKGEDYKLNNNYTAFYARKVMEDHPQLQGFFRTRTQRHEKS